jgi:glycosyltransferase involved in cell wall biosynthesis
MRAERPRLLHVFPSFVVGGAQMRFAAIANHVGDAFAHSIIAMDGRTAARDLLDAAVPVEFPKIETRAGTFASRVGRFAGFLRQMRPQRLMTSNWGSIDWAFARALAGTPHLHMEDGFGPEERDHQLPRRVLTRRAILRRSDIILPSQTLLHIASHVWRLPAQRLHHIANGIDLARFAPSGVRHEGPPVIGTVAALRPEKNIGRLLDAFAIVRAQRPARLVIVGDGAERSGLEQRAASLGVAGDVAFAGHSAAPQTVYAGFDIFALSSDTEQMPLSVLEAMACGLPVAATDVGDVRWMLAEENAPGIAAKSPHALAEAILALLSGPCGIGAANRRRAEAAFSNSAMFAAHVALWSRSLKGQ